MTSNTGAAKHQRRLPLLPLRRRSLLAAAGAVGLAAARCGPAGGDPRLLSEAPLPVQPAAAPTPATYAPVRFPEDEAPHRSLTEWWYYTGHLYAERPATEEPQANGSERTSAPPDEYGFELVFFGGVRGDRPPGYAAHFAITDRPRRRFRYDQRADVALNERPAADQASDSRPVQPGDQNGSRPAGIVSVTSPDGGFDLALGDWRIRGRLGHDQLQATMPGYELSADLIGLVPPALHVNDTSPTPGLILFGPTGYSYYYSRTRMSVSGTLSVDGAPPLAIHGTGWMDHQWGEFLVAGGGWDWFALNLADGRDVALTVLRDAAGAILGAYGTLVDARGQARSLPPTAFAIDATGSWISPHTSIRYPSGWRVKIPDEQLDVFCMPILEDQELETRASTGVAYWEGDVTLQDAAARAELGRGYVELTGYPRVAG